MVVTMEIKGLDKLTKQLAKAPQAIQEIGDVALKKTIVLVEGKAKPFTPVDTGRLRSSYETTFQPMSARLLVNTQYAIYVHDGTARVPERPFLQQGIDAGQDEIDTIWAEAGDEILRQLFK